MLPNSSVGFRAFRRNSEYRVVQGFRGVLWLGRRRGASISKSHESRTMTFDSSLDEFVFRITLAHGETTGCSGIVASFAKYADSSFQTGITMKLSSIDWHFAR